MSSIALLRGINVGGRNRLPMADLRAWCGELGWEDVRTYIQSGNVVFRAEGPRPTMESELERIIELRSGLSIPVIIRTAAEWVGYLQRNPFPGAAEREPNLLMLAVPRKPPAADVADRLQERATAGERVALAGDVLWIHFPEGAGRSKLTPALLDRAAGSPVTTRNWRTAERLAELAGSGSAR